MKVFMFGLAHTTPTQTWSALRRPPTAATTPGLVHAECLTPMTLGAPIISPRRVQFRAIALFAAWDSEDAIDEFLASHPLGERIAEGWHLRMSFLRRWGSVREFSDLPANGGDSDPEAPVAAFTLARMRLLEVPRFVYWGRPVETQVRDDPETTFAFAGIRYPRTIATFSMWTSQRAMIDMVAGRGKVADPERHARAMRERERRDFHHEFTTLRFLPLAEFGSWTGNAQEGER